MKYLQPHYPKELILKKKHYCMKKGQKLRKISYDTYRCTKLSNCQKIWELNEIMDKL